MKHKQGRVIEVDSVEDLERRLTQGVTSIRGWRLRQLDLSDHSDLLHRVRVAGAIFVDCELAEADQAWIADEGALVMPAIDDIPIERNPSTLYTPDDLYDTAEYADSLDARAYAWAQQTSVNSDDSLARALHDHGLDEALTRWIRGRRVVGVMGGHSAERGTSDYRAAAELGHALGSLGGHTVATGGGPGAMEAANLGAALSHLDLDAVADACQMLSAVPSFRPSIQAWVDAARIAIDTVGATTASLGIPTWHYGHEPPNLFATGIAKYFRNSTREATLLTICNGGIVFLPGAAGTVQEVFQDACENYYADPSSVSPMVLVGRTYWTETLPVWQLLTALARERTMAPLIHLVDSPAEAAAVIWQNTSQ